MMKLALKQRIMSSIYILYFVRKLKTPLVAESLIFLMLAASLFYFVSVPNFFSNMFESGNFWSYFVMAFSHTDFLVQMAIVLTFTVSILFVRNLTVFAILKNRPV